MMQIKFTYISIKSWIIDSNVDGFFNCSGNAMVLPPYYLDIILCGGVVIVATVVVYRGGFLWVLFESFSKGPRGLSYVFLITSKVPTLEPIDGLTFIFHEVLIFGGNQEFFNGAVTFEVGLNTIPTADLFNAFA